MTTRRGGAFVVQVQFTDEWAVSVIQRAESLDMPTGTYITAVIVGALRRGSADALAVAGAEVVKTKRRPRTNKRRWQPLEKGLRTWEEWTLTRRGNHNTNSLRAKPGDGWYISGPGIDNERFLGLRYPDASELADEILDALKRAGT